MFENIYNNIKCKIDQLIDDKISHYPEFDKERMTQEIKNKLEQYVNNLISQKENNKQLKFIDLFCGIGGFHIALENLGHKCVFASDIDKKCRETYEANHHLKPIGDITKIKVEDIPDFDILCGGFPCFIKGTKVLTDEGYKNIEDVIGHELLLTHTGKFQKILNLQRKIYKGKLYHIKAKYHPSPVICTEEHPFYVRERKRIWNNKIRRYEYYFNKPEWKKANKLTKNDYFGMKINNKNIIPTFTFQKKINQHKVSNISLNLDKPNQWFMMGYFVGDGWIEETQKKDGRCMNRIRFAINNNDEEYVLDRIRTSLPITDKKCSCSTGKCKKFGCTNFLWFNIFKQFGKYAHGKLIPEWVQDAPKEFIEEFINGYRIADGHVNKKNCHSITTVSYNLAFGLQRLYLKLGHLFSITKYIRPKPTVIEGRTVNQRDTYQIYGYTRENKRKYSSFIEDDYVWYAPFKIETKNVEEEMVYNFEVENDNSYIVENIVCHNCQTFSHAGKQKGFADKTRGTLFYNIINILKEKQPKYFILENVKNLYTHDKGNTWKVMYNALIELDYHTYEKPIICSPLHLDIPQNRDRMFIIGIKKGLGTLKEYPVLTKKDTNIDTILDKEIDKDLFQKLKISDNLLTVLESWETFVQYFKKLNIKLPTFPIWTEYFIDEFDYSNFPGWKQKFIKQNLEFYKTHKSFLKEWLENAKKCEYFSGSKAKFEWQCGKFQTDDSMWTLCFTPRPSGIRVKRMNYSPTLVAMTQILYIGSLKRKLSPREVARLQSFPETFKYHSSFNVAYKQFGNAVNVKVVEYIANHLLSPLHLGIPLH